MYEQGLDWGWVFMCVALVTLAAAFAVVVVANANLAKRVRRLETHRDVLQGAVLESYHTFRRYMQLHYAKKGGPDADAKGLANAQLAGRMKRALERTGYRFPSPIQQAVDGIARAMRGQSAQEDASDGC